MTISHEAVLKKNFDHHINKMYKPKEWPIHAWGYFHYDVKNRKPLEIEIPVGEPFELVCFNVTPECAIYFILKYKGKYWSYCDIGDYGCTCGDTTEYGLKRFNLIAEEVETKSPKRKPKKRKLKSQDVFWKLMKYDNSTGDYNWIPFAFIDSKNLAEEFRSYMKAWIRYTEENED